MIVKVLLILLSSCHIHIPLTMRLCNSRIPEECLMCYQTSQRNWVIIKMLHMYFRRCLLGCHRSILGFFTSSIGEVSLGPLGNAHCRCQNRRISGRGSRTVRLRRMVIGGGGHNVYPGSGPLDGSNTLLPAWLIWMIWVLQELIYHEIVEAKP